MNDQIFLLFEEKEIFLWDYSDILQLDLGCVAFLVLMYCIFILLMVVTSVGFIVILNSHCSHCLVGLNICVSFIFSSFETTCRSFFFVIFDRLICWSFIQVYSSNIGYCFYYERNFLCFFFLFRLWLFLPSQLFFTIGCFEIFFYYQT